MCNFKATLSPVHSFTLLPVLQVPGSTMPVSLLWAVDVYGRVYSLSTAGQLWEQCRDAQMEFKRVTAAQQCCWGIACDNNIYLNVHASDLPVRYQEETYENQVGPVNIRNTQRAFTSCTKYPE